MARLEVEIGGNTAGLGKAGTQAIGILENLQKVASGLKIDLFKATDVVSLNAIGNTLTNVTGQIRSYTDEATKGSRAWQLQQTEAILGSLSTRISVLTANAQLFGDSIKNQKAQITAYEQAISKLLANGLTPTDAKVQSLKKNIDSLNATMAKDVASKAAADAVALNRQYQNTGGLIADLENKVKRLRAALTGATDERSVVRYNQRLRDAQVELTRVRNLGVDTGVTLTNSANSAANAAKGLSRGYNTVGLEFGRIIQDAPYAAQNFGSIANNITRLTEVLPGYNEQLRATLSAQGKAVTTGAVWRAGLLGLVSGFGLVTLGVSALTTAYTIYTMRQQKAAREAEKLKKVNEDFINTINGVARATAQGNISAQEQITTLRNLYAIYQDSNRTLDERRAAFYQLQQLHPEVFLKYEEVAAKGTTVAYRALTESILASSRARAAANLITKNAERQMENEAKIVAARIRQQKALAKEEAAIAKNAPKEGTDPRIAARALAIAKSTKAATEARKEREAEDKIISNLTTDTRKLTTENDRLAKQAQSTIKTTTGLIGGLEERLKGLQAVRPLLKTEADLKANASQIKSVQAQLEKYNATLSKAKSVKTVRDVITPAVEKTTGTAELAGLQGNDADVEKIRQRYEKVYSDITEAANKKDADLRKLEESRSQAEANEAREISQVIVAEKTRVAEEIQRIQNESGIRASESREKELAQINKWYDDQVIKAQGNAEILAAIEEGKQVQIDGITVKYETKRLEAQQAVSDKIQALVDKEFRINDRNTTKGTLAIQTELEKRLKAYDEYFKKLKAMYANDPTAQLALDVAQTEIKNKTTKEAAKANDAGLGKELSRSVSKFGTDMFKTLSTINQRADQTFGSIISDLGKNLNSAINDVFLDKFQKKLEESLGASFDKLDEETQQIIGGLAVAGNLISGATKKTSTLGQATGGALSGAATGAVIGSAIPGVGTLLGGVVGGIAGALGGIFGASKARKQEELEKKQLAEAEKQTKLLERQNALTYTSSIIGQMTNQGIVTGVERSATGELVAKISGQDIAFILRRAEQSSKRGV